MSHSTNAAAAIAVGVALTLGVVGPACRRQAPAAPPLPQVSGTLVVGGLNAPVRVIRDRWGVPHIYAANQPDLFFAQGFVQAQDRLFQIDLWRRSAQGRLAEVLGANFIERDAMTRRMQYHGALSAEWVSYGADTQAIAESFVRGINAWIDVVADHPPEEFALAGWSPEHWSAVDLLNRTDAFLASANASDDVLRAMLVAKLGPVQADALSQAVFAARLSVPRGLDASAISYVILEALRAVGTPPFFSGLAAPVQTTAASLIRAPPERLTAVSDTREGSGSNAWAVGADRSATGAPLLAADPHRALANPSLQYLVHLNAPGWNVIGAAAPWLPGVAIGHNDALAWGTTSRAADVQDVYVEKLNPANPHQAELAGRWVDTKLIADPIAVKGKAAPFPFERESTGHGVIIASDRERHLAFTVRWTGFEPGGAAGLASLAVDRAQSLDELNAALDRWKLPAATFVYAVRDGAVGTAVAGWVPVRQGWSGALPAPAWTGGDEWQRFRRDGEPSPAGSTRGYALSANGSFARARRIEDVLSAPGSLSIDDFKRLQHDTRAWNADQLVPLLALVTSDRADVEDARRRLLVWNRRLDADSPEAAIYVLWERSLLRRLGRGKLAAAVGDELSARAGGALVAAMTKPSSVWFTRPAVHARDEMLSQALADAVGLLAAPPLNASSSWGILHAAIFRHPLAVTAAARQRFNVGPFERGGYAETVMSTGGVDLEQTSGATFSVIADVGDWDRSVATNAPGQSGSPASAHFADLATLWAAGAYFPLSFSAAAVERNAATTLTLSPGAR